MVECISNDPVINEWKRFLEAVNSNPTVRPIIMEARKRCKELGLKAEKLRYIFLSDSELKQKIQKNLKLIQAVKPYMDDLSVRLYGIPHMVTLSDAEGWIIDCRGVMEDLGGKAAGLCIGASWAEKDVGNNGIGTALATGKPVFIYEAEHYGKSFGPYGCIGIPIRNNSQIVGALDIGVPIEYATPARLYIAAACVNSIEKALSNNSLEPFEISSGFKMSATTELIATAVHDLKNPLSVIRGLGELGRLVTNDSKISDYFSRVIRQADEMDNIVVDLLSIFKPEELIPRKVVPILQDILHEFDPICKSKNIKLIFTNYEDEFVNMSERLFKRSIGNLITNAVQAIDDRGIIEVGTKLSNKHMIITIRDTAGGIPEEIKETLFEAFTFKRSQGTGLGLFMVHHTITNTHRGKIWFESKQGEGTTFFIKLPVTEGKRDSLYFTHKFI